MECFRTFHFPMPPNASQCLHIPKVPRSYRVIGKSELPPICSLFVWTWVGRDVSSYLGGLTLVRPPLALPLSSPTSCFSHADLNQIIHSSDVVKSVACTSVGKVRLRFRHPLIHFPSLGRQPAKLPPSHYYYSIPVGRNLTSLE